MPSRLQVGALLSFAVAVWTGLVAIRGLPLGWAYVWPFGSVLGVVMLALLAWDKLLWRTAWLHGWFVKRPDLRGTWRARLVSDWRNPETGRQPGPVDGFVAITQTFSRLEFRLLTAESESWFLASEIRESLKGSGYQVFGVYMNQPDPALRGSRSEIHFGSLALDTHGDAQRPASLSGEYWTDRGTKGTMQLSDRTASVYTQFNTASSRMGSSSD